VVAEVAEHDGEGSF